MVNCDSQKDQPRKDRNSLLLSIVCALNAFQIMVLNIRYWRLIKYVGSIMEILEEHNNLFAIIAEILKDIRFLIV